MDTVFVCPFCKLFSTEKLQYLASHAGRYHKTSKQDLYDEMFCKNCRPVCACGCGQTPGFRSITLGYAKYIDGHNARVQNGWGHNPVAKENARIARNKTFASPEFVPWNKGLTRETDERVERCAINCSLGTGPEVRKRRSDLLKEMRRNGRCPTPRRERSGNWRGGVSQVGILVRAMMYASWTKPIMQRDGFRCALCGNNGKLCVHHHKERCAAIVHKAIAALGEPGDDYDKKVAVAQWAVEYHLRENVSGVTLCKECHTAVHSLEAQTGIADGYEALKSSSG